MNHRSFGTFFELGGRGAMESLTRTGLDYVIIDTEHGCFSEETTADLILAAEKGGLLPFVRIGDIRRPYVLRMLDIGARGLIVPNIRTLKQVQKLIDCAKFPPLGRRGYCPNRTSGWGADEWSRDVFAYMDECNRRVKLIPQCETRDALEQIEEIAALPGVDGIFIGPFDLSTTMGIPGQFADPEFLAAELRIKKACEAAEKPCYILSMTEEEGSRLLNEGYAGVAHSLDFAMFTDAYTKTVRAIRDGLKKKDGSRRTR